MAVIASGWILAVLSCALPLGWLEQILIFLSPDHDVQSKTLHLAAAILSRLSSVFFLGAGFCGLYLALGLSISRSQALPSLEGHRGVGLCRKDIFLLALIVLAALVVRWPFMSRSLSYDEISAWVRYIQPGSLGALFYPYVQNHVGCTLLAGLSAGLMGVSEWSLRLPSLVLGLMTVAAGFAWIMQILGRRAAFLVACFLAFSPVHAIISASARGYAGFVLCTLLSFAAYARYLRRPSRGALLAYVMAGLAGLLFHPFFFFLLLAEIIALEFPFFAGRKRAGVYPGALKIWQVAGILIFLGLLFYVPTAVSLYEEVSTGAEVSTVLSWTTFTELLGVSWLSALIALPVMGIGFWFLRRTSLAGMAPVTGVLALGALFMGWIVSPEYLRARFWSCLMPFMFIGFAAGLVVIFDRLRSRSFILACLLIIVPCGLVGRDWLVLKNDSVLELDPPFRDIAAVARAYAGPDTAFFGIGHGADLFSFYYPDRPITVIWKHSEYVQFLKDHPDAGCFVLPEMDQTPATQEILRDVQARGREYRARHYAVYFMGS